MILITKTSDQTRQRGMYVPGMHVCMYVFIKLHITTQSGPVILVCMYVLYVCIFIKLHITAQSGLVILVILCHLH